MRKVVLEIAMSLDGYIADENGGVGWLGGDNSEHDKPEPSDNIEPGHFDKFMETVDTVILGYTTYHQIVTELNPDGWAYPGKTSYVITHREVVTDNKEIVITSEDPCELVRKLKEQDGKDIWICGGASIVNQLMDADLIDKINISYMPILLGKGIPLFTNHEHAMPLTYIRSEVSDGIVSLEYERRA